MPSEATAINAKANKNVKMMEEERRSGGERSLETKRMSAVAICDFGS